MVAAAPASERRTGELFILQDTELKGAITWMEKGTAAIMMFTRGDFAEEYVTRIYPTRPIVVYRVRKEQMKDFVQNMLNSGIEYAIIDVPWQHADITESYNDEVVRDYAIVDLNMVRARFL